MKKSEDTHGKKVETIKKKLIELNLAIHPLTVRSNFYVPDVITDIDDNLIVIDFINTKERITPDIGGLCLIQNEHNVGCVMGVIDDKLWKKYEGHFKKAQKNLPSKIVLLPEEELEKWLESALRTSDVKPSPTEMDVMKIFERPSHVREFERMTYELNECVSYLNIAKTTIKKHFIHARKEIHFLEELVNVIEKEIKNLRLERQPFYKLHGDSQPKL